MNIGERIISLRKMANISQKELAKLLGMSTTSMNRIELGTRPLRDDEIAKISDVFDISADFLLGRASSRKEGGTEYSKEMRNFLAIARESLGHSNTSITMNVYGHVYKDADSEIAVNLDKLVSK